MVGGQQDVGGAYGYDSDEDDELLSGEDPAYTPRRHRHAADSYREMREAGWVDDPLRGLLDDRLEDILEG